MKRIIKYQLGAKKHIILINKWLFKEKDVNVFHIASAQSCLKIDNASRFTIKK